MSPPTGLNEEDKVVQQDTIAVQEDKQRRAAELKAQIAKNEQDIDQCNEAIGRYGREFLYGVRDLEKILGVTACPLEREQLMLLRICPCWLRKIWALEISEQLEAERKPLHKADQPWKRLEKISDADESEEASEELLIRRVRFIFNKVTPTTEEELTKEFIGLKVHQSQALKEVVSIIFDLAVEEPKFCEIVARMCGSQVDEDGLGVWRLRTAFIDRVLQTFVLADLPYNANSKKFDKKYAWIYEKSENERGLDLIGTGSELRRRKFGIVMFIGQLYLHGLLSPHIITSCVTSLLNFGFRSGREKCMRIRVDEESIEFLLLLLPAVGRRLLELSTLRSGAHETDRALRSIVDRICVTLVYANPLVRSSRVRLMITRLGKLRANGWDHKEAVDEGPKTIDEMREGLDEKIKEKMNRRAVLRKLQVTAEQKKERESNEPTVLEPISETSKDEEARKKLLVSRVCGIFDNVTPEYRVSLTKEFLALRVHESPALNEIVSIIFDRAVEEPKLCELYADMCAAQEALELEDCGTFHFRTALRRRVKKACLMSNMEKALDRIYAEVFENGFDLLGTKDELRRIEVVMFIGQLYLKGMLSLRAIKFCCLDTLLSRVIDLCKEKRPVGGADEAWVECAVLLLTNVGKQLYAEWEPLGLVHPLDKALTALENAKPLVSSRVRFMITNLVERSFERRADRWAPTDYVDVEGSKKVDEVGEGLDEEIKQKMNRRAGILPN